MHGFVIIDKPAGLSSHDIVSRVRRIIGTRKVGHTGTLDPFATGVLPVAVNEATKAIQFLDECVKCYTAVMKLGVTTDTLDLTGTVMAESAFENISSEVLNRTLAKFTGKIFQIPPMYSAIKRDGQPLYKLARQGVEIERQPRPVEIYSLEMESYQLPFVTFSVKCSRGTYIRTLADDIGKHLGCGAALKELRRTASGLFTIENAVTLEKLEAAQINRAAESIFIESSAALGHLPEVHLNLSGFKKISFGISPVSEDTTFSGPLSAPAGALVRLTFDRFLAAVAAVEFTENEVVRFVLQRVFLCENVSEKE